MEKYRANAAASSASGSGPVRENAYRPNADFADPFDREKRGFDIVTDPAVIRHPAACSSISSIRMA